MTVLTNFISKFIKYLLMIEKNSDISSFDLKKKKHNQGNVILGSIYYRNETTFLMT